MKSPQCQTDRLEKSQNFFRKSTFLKVNYCTQTVRVIFTILIWCLVSVNLQSAQVEGYPTLADLVSSQLQVNNYYTTLGYTSPNDGGGASYLIQTAAAYGGTPDGYCDHWADAAHTIVAVLQIPAGSYITPDMCGAVSGSDARPAISAMMSKHPRLVRFMPGKTYLVGSYAEPASGKMVRLYSTHSGVTIEGYGATIKVVDGINSGTIPFHAIFGCPGDQLISNVTILGLTFDFNGANNIIPSTASITNAAVLFNYSNNITIKDCTFLNNPGYNSIVLGSSAGTIATNSIIVNNKFLNFAHGIAGNNNTSDHSCIFVCGNYNVVTGNILKNDTKCTVSTAIECDSSNGVVSGNVIKNTRIGVIVATCGAVPALVNSSVVNNQMDLVDIAYSLWTPGSGQTARNIRFSGNNGTLSCPQYEGGAQYAINLRTWTVQAYSVSDVHIEDNTFYMPSVTVNACRWFGIGLTNVSHAKIKGNIIHDITGPALYMSNVVDVNVSQNSFYDVARSTATGDDTASAIFALQTVENVKIMDNYIYDSLWSGSPYMKTGIYCYGAVRKATISDNSIILGVSGSNEILTEGVTATGVGYFNVSHTLTNKTGRPTRIRASQESKVFDSTANRLYEKITATFDGAGWRARYSSTTIPTESATAGDTVRHSDAGLNEAGYWINTGTTTWGRLQIIP